MITNIHLQHFRSYKEAAFELAPGVNIIVGPNASGKTNLLEAILILARGKSYRDDAELVKFTKQWARLESYTPSEQRVVKIEASQAAEKPQKSFIINDQIYKRLP